MISYRNIAKENIDFSSPIIEMVTKMFARQPKIGEIFRLKHEQQTSSLDAGSSFGAKE